VLPQEPGLPRARGRLEGSAAHREWPADSLKEDEDGLAIRGLCPRIKVLDMPTSHRFHRAVFGFEEVEMPGRGEDVGWAWLRRGDAAVMLNTAYDTGDRSPAPDPARVAAPGDTALFLGCQDLDAAYAHRVAQGVRAKVPRIAPYGPRHAVREGTRRFRAMLPVAGAGPRGAGLAASGPEEAGRRGLEVRSGVWNTFGVGRVRASPLV
jgi:glyoxylase I family protein